LKEQEEQKLQFIKLSSLKSSHVMSQLLVLIFLKKKKT